MERMTDMDDPTDLDIPVRYRTLHAPNLTALANQLSPMERVVYIARDRFNDALLTALTMQSVDYPEPAS